MSMAWPGVEEVTVLLVKRALPLAELGEAFFGLVEAPFFGDLPLNSFSMVSIFSAFHPRPGA